ncbi:Dynamin-1 [Halotydeus destructor]|nr:Dynamin-1 [Halotydeus destructor]
MYFNSLLTMPILDNLKNIMTTPKKISPLNVGMESLVSVVNNLQDIFGRLQNKDLAFSLPQIAVVGGQSSGKSSVLESVVGRDFLPRGTGIVTRCPLILQMNNCECEENWVFEHLPGQRFTEPDDVRAQISMRTDEIAGTSKGVSSEAITLKFYSPRVLDITLVDLPGLTNIAIEGQPLDIVDQIRDLVFQYINNENVLILAITPANQDLATSDALKVASQADPKFERTFGVLTKLDLVEPENERAIRKVLDNEHFKLNEEFGFIGVINRSQRDIDEGRDMEYVCKKEEEAIDKRKLFRQIKGRLGTKFLQKVLNGQLKKHIERSMPNIKEDILQRMQESDRKLSSYGDLSEDQGALVAKLVNMIRDISSQLERSLGAASGDEVESHKKSMGLVLREQLSKYSDVLQQLSFDDEEIKKQMCLKLLNLQGLEPGFFPPNQALIGIIKQYTDNFVGPSADVIKGVESAMQIVIEELEKNFHGYPKLLLYTRRILSNQLAERLKATRTRIEQFVEEDKVYVDTESEHFQVEFKRLERESKSLLVVSAGQHQEVCSGLLKGSDGAVYSCRLTPAKLSFQRYGSNLEELYPINTISVSDYTFDSQDAFWFRIKFNKPTGGIEHLDSHQEENGGDSDKTQTWIKHLRQLIKNRSAKEQLMQRREIDKVDLLKSTKMDEVDIPAYLKNPIDTMFEIFVKFMEIGKMKYSEHIRKTICYNIIVCFKLFVRDLLFEALYKEANSDIIALMARSDDAQEIIENLKEEIAACEEALEAIEEVTVS